MTAAYRLRGIGWFVSGVIVVLGCYLVSLQVAAERKRVSDVGAAIEQARRDIRQLETEFSTRANLAQLERWNGEILALAAPAADQFVDSEAALGRADFATSPTVDGRIRTAAMVVPSAPAAMPQATVAALTAPVPAPAAVMPPAPQPALPGPAVERPVPGPIMASATIVSARAKPTPAVATHSGPRPRSVALLDRKLLRENRLADLIRDIPLDQGSAR